MNSIVSNVKIYDLEESIIASGYPMRTDTDAKEINEKDIKRCHTLSAASDNGNPAHGQFLTGIRVSFDLTFTNKAWVEAERYRFLEFVSSQSTMHRITKFNLDEQYIDYVDPRIINIMKEKVEEYLNVNINEWNYIKLCNVNLSKEISPLFIRSVWMHPGTCASISNAPIGESSQLTRHAPLRSEVLLIYTS